jgi:uncharacterized protein YndB with AHSA1/START domain
MSAGQVMKVAAVTLAGTVLIMALIVYAVGSALPVAHVAAVRGELPATRERVWQTITDWPQYTQWRTDVAAVVVRSSQGDSTTWVEVDAWGDSLTLATVEVDAPRRLVTRIAQEDAPFAGTWTFELDDDGPGTYLRIVEEGEVYDPIFRFVAAVFIGQTATLDTYLSDLRRHLEEHR